LLRPDNDEIDRAVAREGDDGVLVCRIEASELGMLRDSGVSGRGIERLDLGRLRQFPGQRVLAAAGSDKKDAHCSARVAAEGRRCLAQRTACQRPTIFV